MHEPKNGHFLIHYAGKPVQAAKDVLDTREFRFFIDDELCIIRAEKDKKDNWDYILSFDHKVDTPLNTARKKLERKHLVQSIAAFSGIAFLLVLILGIGYTVNFYYDKESLKENGYVTIATIVSTPQSTPGARKCEYVYQITSMYSLEGSISCSSLKAITDANGTGLPISVGDTYYMKYDITEYTNHQVFFDQPTAETLTQLKLKTRNRLTQLDRSITMQQAGCIVDQAHRLYGMQGLADIFFSQTISSINKTSDVKFINELINSCQ